MHMLNPHCGVDRDSRGVVRLTICNAGSLNILGSAVINGVREQGRGMASSLVIILRLIGMSVSMSSMTAYGLRRTTVLGREMISPNDALDLEKTARVALDVVTKITSEMALISLAVAVTAVGVALLLRRDDGETQLA